MNIAWTIFIRFIIATQSICCPVLSTSYVFLTSNIGFPNLSLWTYFFVGICVNETITFSKSSGLILGVAGITYAREIIFLVLQDLESWSRRLHSSLLKILRQIAMNETFEEEMIRKTFSILTRISKEIFWKLIVLILANIHCTFLLLENI